MNDLKIQQVWNYSYAEFSQHQIQSQEQLKTSHAIQNCKTGMLGATISQCTDCGHIEYHNNSCRNRNCQAVKKNSGWINVEPKSLTRRIFMWSLRFLMN